MDSFEAWSCIAERMDQSSLANVETAFGVECDPGAAVRKERDMRYEFVYTECEEDTERIRSMLIERQSLRYALERYFDVFSEVVRAHKGRGDDITDLFVHSLLQPDQVAMFTEDHYLAARMLLPLSMEPRAECKPLAPLTRIADMVDRLESQRVAHSLSWIFLDALGLEEGSFVLMMLTLGTRRPMQQGKYCFPALHPLIVLATECWDRHSDGRTRIAELVSRGRAAVESRRTKSCNLEMARRMLRKYPLHFVARRSGYLDYNGIRTGDFATFEEWREEARKMFESCIGAYESNLRKVRDAMTRQTSAKMANASMTFEKEVWTTVLIFKRPTCCHAFR